MVALRSYAVSRSFRLRENPMRTRCQFHKLTLALLLLTAVPSADAYPQKSTASYTVTDLGGLPGLSYEYSTAMAINDAGEIVGSSYTVGPDGPVNHAVVWAKDGAGNYVITDLGIAGWAGGINSHGDIAAENYLIEPVIINVSPVWYQDLNGDGVNDLQTPFGTYVTARAISDNVQIVAGPDLVQFDAAGTESMTTLPNGGYGYAINDYGEVAGYDNTLQATIWQVDAQGKVQDTYPLAPLPDYRTSNALGIDALGQAVGESSYTDHRKVYMHATLWRDPTAPPTDLGVLVKGGTSQAWGVNSVNGVTVVVGTASVSGGQSAFVWTNGMMTDLNKLITVAGINLQSANAVNSHGQIAGFAHVTVGGNVETHAVLLTPN